jgi:hypothetical protein
MAITIEDVVYYYEGYRIRSKYYRAVDNKIRELQDIVDCVEASPHPSTLDLWNEPEIKVGDPVYFRSDLSPTVVTGVNGDLFEVAGRTQWMRKCHLFPQERSIQGVVCKGPMLLHLYKLMTGLKVVDTDHFTIEHSHRLKTITSEVLSSGLLIRDIVKFVLLDYIY